MTYVHTYVPAGQVHYMSTWCSLMNQPGPTTYFLNLVSTSHESAWSDTGWNLLLKSNLIVISVVIWVYCTCTAQASLRVSPHAQEQKGTIRITVSLLYYVHISESETSNPPFHLDLSLGNVKLRMNCFMVAVSMWSLSCGQCQLPACLGIWCCWCDFYYGHPGNSIETIEKSPITWPQNKDKFISLRIK